MREWAGDSDSGSGEEGEMLSKPIHNFRVVYTCHKFTYEFHAIFYNREFFSGGKSFILFLKG